MALGDRLPTVVWLKAYWRQAVAALLAVAGLVAGLVFVAIGKETGGVALLGIGALFSALAMYGDRITKVGAGGVTVEMTAAKAAKAAKDIVAERTVRQGAFTADAVIGQGDIVGPVPKVSGTGNVTVSPSGATLNLTGHPPTVEVRPATPADLATAAKAIDGAVTPSELADRVANFVRLAAEPDRAAVLQYLASLSVDDRAELVAEADTLAGRMSEQENP